MQMIHRCLSPEWPALRNWALSPLFRLGPLWLASVPVAAKALTGVESVSTDWMNGDIALSLPFSWVVFFFAALASSVATIVFELTCPKLVKMHSSASDWLSAGNGWRQVATELENAGMHHRADCDELPTRLFDGLSVGAKTEILDRTGIDFDMELLVRALRATDFDDREAANAFWQLHGQLARYMLPWRRLVAGALAISSVLYVVVLLENIGFVVRQML